VPVAAARVWPRLGFEQAAEIASCFCLYLYVTNVREKFNGKESVTEWSRITSSRTWLRTRYIIEQNGDREQRRVTLRVRVSYYSPYRTCATKKIIHACLCGLIRQRSVAGNRRIRGFAEFQPNRENGTRRTGVKLPARPLIVPSWSYPLCIRCAVQMTDASGETRGERRSLIRSA
jgi:hypothetical protein